MRILLMAFLLSGAVKAEEPPLFRWEQPKAHEVIALGVAETMIWLDILQTLDWNRKGQFSAETNPILGAHPSVSKIVLVGGVLPSAALALVWLATPSEWRMVPCGAVIGAEAGTIIFNSANGLAIRF